MPGTACLYYSGLPARHSTSWIFRWDREKKRCLSKAAIDFDTVETASDPEGGKERRGRPASMIHVDESEPVGGETVCKFFPLQRILAIVKLDFSSLPLATSRLCVLADSGYTNFYCGQQSQTSLCITLHSYHSLSISSANFGRFFIKFILSRCYYGSISNFQRIRIN